jgi:hypothetical protein
MAHDKWSGQECPARHAFMFRETGTTGPEIFERSTMQHVPLDSRLLSAVGYNADSETLHVWLRDKRHVVHHGISEAIYANLLNAESAGFYYTCYIARNEPQAARHYTRTVVKLAAACLISIVLCSAFTTALAGPML